MVNFLNHPLHMLDLMGTYKYLDCLEETFDIFWYNVQQTWVIGNKAVADFNKINRVTNGLHWWYSLFHTDSFGCIGWTWKYKKFYLKNSCLKIAQFDHNNFKKPGFEGSVSGMWNAIYFSIIVMPKKSHFTIFVIQNFDCLYHNFSVSTYSNNGM